MAHFQPDTPFLVSKDNASFLTGDRPAVPQRSGDGAFDLIVGALVGGAGLLSLVALVWLGRDLGGTLLALLAAVAAGLFYAALMLRSGLRAVRLAHTYRTRGRQVSGVFTALELVDEGAGDWFLKGSYQFEEETGRVGRGAFSQYRPDLVGKPLPTIGTRAVILYVDEDHYTIL